MRPKTRAYTHQGHGPRADDTGRIHISDFRYSRTKLTCDQQPVHTFATNVGRRGKLCLRPEADIDVTARKVAVAPLMRSRGVRANCRLRDFRLFATRLLHGLHRQTDT